MKKNINYFIDLAEKRLNNGFNFDETDFDGIINKLERENEEYEEICWRELVDQLISNGWYYDDEEEAIYCDEYVKELGLMDEDDLDDDDYE